MFKSKIMLSFAVGVLTCLIVMVSPIATHASAVGIQYWGTFTVNVDGQSINIPSGQLTHEINGKGYHITWDGANFISAANLCDPSIHFTYGNGAYELRGNVHWGCSRGGQWKYLLNQNAPRGNACAELWVKNWKAMVTKQCHYVYG